MDKWKFLTIMLSLIAISLVLHLYEENNTYKFGEVEITEKQFQDIANTIGDNFDLCEVDEGDCIRRPQART